MKRSSYFLRPSFLQSLPTLLVLQVSEVAVFLCCLPELFFPHPIFEINLSLEFSARTRASLHFARDALSCV